MDENQTRIKKSTLFLIPLLLFLFSLAPAFAGEHVQESDELPAVISRQQIWNQMISDYETSQKGVSQAPFVMPPATCVAGTAAGYPCSNIDLGGYINIAALGGSGNGNDIWGWTDSGGNEYAIVGVANGTSFVDVTNPSAPVVLGFLPRLSSTWRDVKVYNDHAFIVSEAGGHGMQVFNLNKLPSGPFTTDALYTGFGNAHNIVINEDTGWAYGVGTNTCSGGLHFIDISNPIAPVSGGCFSSDGYTHDAQCVLYNGPDLEHIGKEICFAYNADTVTIVDVTDKSAPVQLSRTGYGGSSYTHQGWINEDQTILFMNDETDEQNFGHNTRTRIVDITDLDALGPFVNFDGATAAIDHNAYVFGNHIFESNYRAGLEVLSGASTGVLSRVAYFDMYASSNSAAFNGTWSNYPYFESGTVILSAYDSNNGANQPGGLFVLSPTNLAADFNIKPDKVVLNACGASDSILFDINALHGHNVTITLSSAGVPAGATGSFAPPSGSNDFSTTFTLNPGTAASGDYLLTVTGSDGSLSYDEYLKLTISAAPGTPTLSSPPNAATDVSTSPTLSWGAATDALNYLLEVDNNSDFSSPEYSNTVAGTSDVASGLAASTTYYWRVTANNLCGSTQSVAPQVSFSFTTAAAPPSSVVCNGATADFEAGIPADWTVTSAGPASWAWNTTVSCGQAGITGESACSDPPAGNGNTGWGRVETPVIDLSTFTAASLDLTYLVDVRNGSTFDIELFDGATWTQLFQETADQLTAVPLTLNLDAYAGNANVQIAFLHTSNGGPRGQHALFDDVVLTCTGPVASPIAAVNPATLANTQATNTVVPTSFDVENSGTGNLNWTLFEDVSGFAAGKEASSMHQFLSAPSAGDPLDIATAYLNDNYATLGLTAPDLGSYRLVDRYTMDHNGVTLLFFEQQYQGISVPRSVFQINVMPDGRILRLTTDQLVTDVANKVNTTVPTLSAEAAYQSAVNALELNYVTGSDIRLQEATGISQETLLSGAGVSLEPVPAKLTYASTGKELRLAWELIIYELDANHWWVIQIDAVTGAELFRYDQVITDRWGIPVETDTGLPATAEEINAVDTRLNAQANTAPAKAADWSIASFANSYTVYPIPDESPIHAAVPAPADGRALMTAPADPVASPFGWHDTNGAPGAESNFTVGNNVIAQEDQNGNNGTGARANGGGAQDFNFPVDWSLAPAGNLDAALTNLFYWNNVIHDMWYHYGFNEAAGNFQENNYGNGGAQSDHVWADGLDGSGTNNANFGTPNDGGNPRMQMFLWSPAPVQKVIVTAPGGVAGTYLSADAGFGNAVPGAPGVPAGNGDYVLALDGTGNNEGCNPFTNGGAMAGNIALIDRGSCAFVLKVQNAENAGAVAAVVMNNVPGGAIIAMGGTCPCPTIPSVMISFEDGQTIRGAGGLQGRLEDPGAGPMLDGDFDNGIIGHEYGHGISNRFTGGPGNSGCLSNTEQMGEGWGDFVGYVMTVEPGDTGTDARGIGNYAIGAAPNGPGIRAFPYSTDMGVDPRTYNDVMAIGDPPASPHAHGSIWAAMLWDLYWDFSDSLGWDADYYTGTGGNNLAIQLVSDGMALQGCSPGFVDGRDGILSAITAMGLPPATETQYECIAWNAFARRGLGFSANQGSVNTLGDGTAAFDMPPALVCVAQPDIDVNPATLASSQLPNVTTPDSFNIDNLGGATLNWSSIVEDPDGCGVGAPPSNVAWVTGVTPTSGSTAAAGASAISFNWDSAGMTPGLYTSYLCIASDDPDEPVFEVRLDLTVTAAPEPDINVNPATLAQAQFPEVVTPDSFNIDNVGAVVLNWSGIVEDPDGCGVGAPASDVAWVTGVTPTSGSTAAAGSTTISYNWDSTGMTPGAYTSYLCIASDDPDEPVFEVTLNLTVNPPVACDFVDDISWITGMTPTSGLTAAAGATTVNFNYDSTGLADGVYNASICLSSDDPTNPMIIVPVTLTVSSACSAPGDVLDLTIAPNAGYVDLSWTGSGAEQYEVHRSSMPYTAPVGNGPTVVGQPVVGPFPDNAITTYGDPATNYYYYLLPENSCGAWANPSNHVGEFDFSIIPGA